MSSAIKSHPPYSTEYLTVSNYRRFSQLAFRFLNIPEYVLRAAALLVLLIALSIILLTRTQFGRDAIRDQVVRSFNNSFEGSLQIGRLQGNIVQDLFASDVRLFDPEGDEVLRIDSLAMRPHWRSLFRGAFIADRVTIVEPYLRLVIDELGQINLARALASRRTPGGPSNPLDFHAANLRVVDGRVFTRNLGELPSSVGSGLVFDYSNAEFSGISAQFELDWRDDIQIFRVDDLQATLGDDALSVESLSALISVADGGVRAENLNLATARSRIRGTFTVPKVADGLDEVDANIVEGRIAAADVTAILPSLPVADAVTLQGHVYGRLATLTVDNLVLSRGGTELLAEGTISGLPDSLAFNLTTPGSRFRSEDVLAVLPTIRLPVEITRLGTVQLQGDVSGAVPLASAGSGFRLQGDVVANSDAGAVDGTVRISASPNRAVSYSFDLVADGINPAVVLADESYAGGLSGSLFAERTGADDNATSFRVALGPSTLAGRTADSLVADGVWHGQTLDAVMTIRQGGSRVEGQLFVDQLASELSFDGTLTAFNSNLLFSEAPVTRFSGPVSIALVGTSLADFQTEVAADFSEAVLEVDGAMQDLPTGPFTLAVAPPGEAGSRFRLTTEIVEAELKGNVGLEAAFILGHRWGNAFFQTVAFEANKPLHSSPKSIDLRPGSSKRFWPSELFQLDIRVLDPDALNAFLPNIPVFSRGTDIVLNGVVGSDSIAVDLGAAGSQMDVGSMEFGRYELRARVEGIYSPNLSETLAIDLEAQAVNLRFGVRRLRQSRVTGQLESRSLSFSVDGNGAFGQKQNALHMRGSVAMRPRNNLLTIEELEVETAGIAWGGNGPIVAVLYSDAAILEQVGFTQTDIETDERLVFSGVLSKEPTDSVFVDIYRLDLGRLAKLGGVRPLRSDPGGMLEGRLALTNLLSRPQVSGSVEVPRLMLGNRILGRLDITSRLTEDRDGVEVDLLLAKPDTSEAIARGILLEENDLNISGLVRFPGRDENGERDAGTLDLTLDVRKADLFFFDLLFSRLLNNTRGSAAGEGTIRGDFSFPEFNADLSVLRGETSIPRFGLELALGGDVDVDKEGIHLVNVQVTDKAGGTASVGGSVLFNDYRFFSLDLNAQLRDIEIIDVPSSTNLAFYGHIQASGTASVTGPLDNVFLRSANAVTTPESEIFIPVRASSIARDRGFIVFADSLGQLPEEEERANLISSKPLSERSFTEGLGMSLNVTAPPSSTVHLVFDEATGDVINAQGNAELQLSIREGRFRTFGTFTTSGGDYLFTAGDVFTRRFEIEPGGLLVWDGDPLDARLDLTADYRTRASLAGLGLAGLDNQRVPLVIRTGIGGRLSAPLVNLSLELDTDQRTGGATSAAVEALRPILNNTDQQALYASSVLLTGTFLLAPVENFSTGGSEVFTEAADELLFTSLSQLVSSRLNFFLSQALASENIEILFGLQPVDAFQRFDLTYGVALRLLDERLVIRGEGVYQQYENQPSGGELQGELAVEVRLSDAVSLEVFYRRESELLGGTSVGITPYDAYGVGLSFERAFTSWKSVLRGLLGTQPEAQAGG